MDRQQRALVHPPRPARALPAPSGLRRPRATARPSATAASTTRHSSLAAAVRDGRHTRPNWQVRSSVPPVVRCAQRTPSVDVDDDRGSHASRARLDRHRERLVPRRGRHHHPRSRRTAPRSAPRSSPAGSSASPSRPATSATLRCRRSAPAARSRCRRGPFRPPGGRRGCRSALRPPGPAAEVDHVAVGVDRRGQPAVPGHRGAEEGRRQARQGRRASADRRPSRPRRATAPTARTTAQTRAAEAIRTPGCNHRPPSATPAPLRLSAAAG